MRHLVLAALLSAATTVPASGQEICYAENDIDAFEDGASTGTALFGIKFSPTVAVTAGRLEVFTGESTDSMSIGIWSHDPNLDQPMASLQTGVFACQPTNDWQGADLPSSVVLDAGGIYWLAWGSASGAQSSQLPSQPIPGQEISVSLDGGASWGPKFQSTERHMKFRLICGCSGPAVEFGAGCPGTSGFVPHLSLDVCPVAGGPVALSISNGLGGAPAILFFGISPIEVEVEDSGCFLLVTPNIALSLTLGGAGGGQGSILLAGTLPAGTSGAVVHAQAFTIDALGANGYAASNAITMTVP